MVQVMFVIWLHSDLQQKDIQYYKLMELAYVPHPGWTVSNIVGDQPLSAKVISVIFSMKHNIYLVRLAINRPAGEKVEEVHHMLVGAHWLVGRIPQLAPSDLPKSDNG